MDATFCTDPDRSLTQASARRVPPLLGLILVVYLLLGAFYALLTPLWQTPDEPAHFNYVRHMAETLQLPVLQPGDYDQAYLETIKARKFPAEMSVERIRYEGHQPPLYYALVTPFYWLTEPSGIRLQVWVLRLLGVVLGAGVVLLIWASCRRLCPSQPDLALAAAGFAAFLPMHVAMMAAVNNDTLAELLIAAGVFRLLGHLRDGPAGRGWFLTGLVVGLALLTKLQAYILVPLAAGVWLWQAARIHMVGRERWRTALAVGLPALLLGLPWWARNMLVYGPGDPMGLVRHDAVVTGQPRTAAWILEQGLGAYGERLVSFTFRSFWGVFGWLGV
ncbi:MAG: hypothetical protein D6775_17200, partial [Caldilineae bacterium]